MSNAVVFVKNLNTHYTVRIFAADTLKVREIPGLTMGEWFRPTAEEAAEVAGDIGNILTEAGLSWHAEWA